MGFAALANVPTFGLAQILLFGGIAETVAMPASQYTGGPQNLPGGYDGSAGTIPGGYPFTEQIEDPAARTRALTCELQNGRAAMMGTFGAMCHSRPLAIPRSWSTVSRRASPPRHRAGAAPPL